MNQQIKKLCKQLSRFSYDEIASILELPDNEVQYLLQELIAENVISQVSETEYAYIPKVTLFVPDKKTTKKEIQELFNNKWISVEEAVKLTGFRKETIRRKCKDGTYTSKSIQKGKNKFYSILKSSIKKYKKLALINDDLEQKFNNINLEYDPNKMFDDKVQQKIFDSATDYNKRHIIKCLNIFKLTNGLVGEELVKMLKYIAQNNPDYKMGYSTFLRWKSCYARNGIIGLMKAYNPPKTKNCVLNEMLEEFEEIFLSPKRYTMRVAWEILKSRHPDEDIPSDKSFNRAINKKYSQEYIKKKRSLVIKLPEFKESINAKIPQKLIFEKVKDALDDFLKILEGRNDNQSVCQKGHIKNHLYPFWSEYKFKDITQTTIMTYQSKMLAEGYSVASIKRFMGLFQRITKKYSDIHNLQFSAKDTILPILENRVLTQKEISSIIADKSKIQDLWVLATGIIPAELAALDYSDIDFNSKTVKISKVKYKDKIENIRAKYRIRTLKLPSVLLDMIPKNKAGLIFKEVKISNFDMLLNTHIKLLLDKNIQINIIIRNLGFYKLTDFENRYNFLLPQNLDDDFQVL